MYDSFYVQFAKSLKDFMDEQKMAGFKVMYVDAFGRYVYMQFKSSCIMNSGLFAEISVFDCLIYLTYSYEYVSLTI